MSDLHDEYWADYEDAIGPPPGAAAKIRARVDRVVARRDRIEPHETEQVPRAAAAILVLKSSAMSVAIAVAALGGLHLAARAIAPTPAELPVSAAAAPAQPRASSEPPAPAASIPATTPTPVIAPPPVDAPPPIARPRASHAAITAVPTPVVDTLAEETALVARARAQMDRKAYADALRSFGEHAKRFPSGVLAPEREAYAAIARCKSGAKGAIFATFTASHPRSLYTERVREACADSSTDRSTPTE